MFKPGDVVICVSLPDEHAAAMDAFRTNSVSVGTKFKVTDFTPDLYGMGPCLASTKEGHTNWMLAKYFELAEDSSGMPPVKYRLKHRYGLEKVG